MTADESLIIVGASARAAAFSALRAKLRPWCADLFADRDLQQRCPTLQVSMPRYPQDLSLVFEQAPPGPWLYTGALENCRQLIERLAGLRPLWGNSGPGLHNVRTPFAVWACLTECGLPCPAVLSQGAKVPVRRSWLLKPLAGAGGRGIRQWTRDAVKPPGRGRWYFQEFVEGMSCAAVYVGKDRQAQLLGVTRQLVGEPWLHAAPFQYCGSIGRLPLAPAVRDRFAHLGNVLAELFRLRGLFGVDCVLKQEEPWPVEINPRYTASVEVLEYATGRSALALHQQAFEPDAAKNRVRYQALPGVVGKAIWYAPAAFTFPEHGPWLETLRRLQDVWELPAYADIPGPGQQIQAGWPVLTYFVQAATVEICLEMLQQQGKALDRWLVPQ